jgi:hypothetical protein
MRDARPRARDDASGGDVPNGNRVRSDKPPATVLAEHPPLVAHVNNCDRCREWLLALSLSAVEVVRRG